MIWVSLLFKLKVGRILLILLSFSPNDNKKIKQVFRSRVNACSYLVMHVKEIFILKENGILLILLRDSFFTRIVYLKCFSASLHADPPHFSLMAESYSVV